MKSGCSSREGPCPHPHRSPGCVRAPCPQSSSPRRRSPSGPHRSSRALRRTRRLHERPGRSRPRPSPEKWTPSPPQTVFSGCRGRSRRRSPRRRSSVLPRSRRFTSASCTFTMSTSRLVSLDDPSNGRLPATATCCPSRRARGRQSPARSPPKSMRACRPAGIAQVASPVATSRRRSVTLARAFLQREHAREAERALRLFELTVDDELVVRPVARDRRSDELETTRLRETRLRCWHSR